MDCASKLAYFKRKKNLESQSNQAQNDFRVLPLFSKETNDVDTNVISINFRNIKQAEENLQMGDPIFCKNCNSSLSFLSTIFTKNEYEKRFYKNGEKIDEEAKGDDISIAIRSETIPLENIHETDRVWVCEFCGLHMQLNIEPEEIPNKEDVVYMLQPAIQISNSNNDEDISVIFCIDNSGSMSVTTEIQGKHDIQHGLSEEEYNTLKEFIEEGVNQYLPYERKNTTYVSRKQCVLAAIENQVVEMKKSHPNRKVGIVTFNDDVVIIGDGKENPEIITEENLYKLDVCKAMGKDNYTKLMSNPVKDSADALIGRFQKFNEGGQTALGPALIVAISMAAQGRKGSKVILCTDGLANIGLGEMDSAYGLSKAPKFYSDAALFAKENGVSVSVISIKGEGCKLEMLGKLADETSGDLIRVDPNEITSNFANVLKEDVLGTGVEIKLRLHKAFKFRNEDEANLKENGSLYAKNIGIVTRGTELTFEYESRSDEELSNLKIDVDHLKFVPFQVQITYNSTNGDKLMRVISKKLRVTENLEEAERESNMQILACRALQKQAAFAQQGRYEESSRCSGKWYSYMENHVLRKSRNPERTKQTFLSFQEKNSVMQVLSAQRRSRLEQKLSSKLIHELVEIDDLGQSDSKNMVRSLPVRNICDSKAFPSKEDKIKPKPNGNYFSDFEARAGDEDEEWEVFHKNKNMSSDLL